MKWPSLACLLFLEAGAFAQSIAFPWSSHAHDPQHSGISLVAAQPLSHIHWQTPVDWNPQYSGDDLLIHYGSPLITRQNTVLVPVKTSATGDFCVEAHAATDGTTLWTEASDYVLPPDDWISEFGIALTPKNRVYFPGAGGTVYYRDAPDQGAGATGQIAFYGLAKYQADPTTFNTNVRINTPLTSDRYGNIFFGFQVLGSTTPALQSGIARIASDGTGLWVAAGTASNDNTITKVAHNCAPALSSDHRTLYIAVNSGGFSAGYLLALDSRTLNTLHAVRLKDAHNLGNDANVPDDGSASPSVGPDGDVFYGVLENPFFSNHDRGWLLHFDSTLTVSKTPGAFGWDDTASMVPAKIVPSYTGTSAYLLVTKYNNYVVGGGDGVNKVAVLDPHDTQTDPVTGATVMKEIMTQAGPTPDQQYVASHPNAVREWCVNTVAVDPFTKCGIVNSEDGHLYRWDFASNSLNQVIAFPAGIGEAYTPTMIGVDGTVYAISNAVLYAIGQ